MFQGIAPRAILSGIFAAILAAATAPVAAQTTAAATEGGLSLAVGGGAASYDVDVDWGYGRMLGGALWIDYYPRLVPRILHGIGIEAEARDIRFGASSTQVDYRSDTAGGGLIYTWRHFRNFYPYGKADYEFGSIDFKISDPHYTHDTRSLLAPGMGFETRVYRHVWLRADYEYQFWQTLMTRRPDPQGFTVGAMYDFRAFHRR